jgi:hypothetical protein
MEHFLLDRQKTVNDVLCRAAHRVLQRRFLLARCNNVSRLARKCDLIHARNRSAIFCTPVFVKVSVKRTIYIYIYIYNCTQNRESVRIVTTEICVCPYTWYEFKCADFCQTRGYSLNSCIHHQNRMFSKNNIECTGKLHLRPKVKYSSFFFALIFSRLRRIAKSDYYFRHVCLSVFLVVRPHGPTLLLLDRFLWNLILEYFFLNITRNLKFY